MPDTYALIWHDLHTDALVYLYPNKERARYGAVTHLIEYLRSGPERHHGLADWLEELRPSIAYDMAIGKEEITNLDYLYWHVTPVLRDGDTDDRA
jgi:hypothetical protein